MMRLLKVDETGVMIEVTCWKIMKTGFENESTCWTFMKTSFMVELSCWRLMKTSFELRIDKKWLYGWANLLITDETFVAIMQSC